MVNDPDTFQQKWVAENFARCKMERGLTQSKLGVALGISQPQARALVLGTRKLKADEIPILEQLFNAAYSQHLDKIAETRELISDEDKARSRTDYPANAVVGQKLAQYEPFKIPLYGHAVGGIDGEFVLNGNKLDDITAPPSLLGIHGAYAVTVSGDSMEPRYEDGETLFLDPQKRVSRGDYVVAQVQTEESGPVLAFIKKFVRHNSKELVVEQFNPPKQLTFAHENVVSVDYVVMGGRLF